MVENCDGKLRSLGIYPCHCAFRTKNGRKMAAYSRRNETKNGAFETKNTLSPTNTPLFARAFLRATRRPLPPRSLSFRESICSSSSLPRLPPTPAGRPTCRPPARPVRLARASCCHLAVSQNPATSASIDANRLGRGVSIGRTGVQGDGAFAFACTTNFVCNEGKQPPECPIAPRVH